MARSKIPNPLTRRHLIEKKMSEAQTLQLAEAYLAEGRSIEALDFLAKAEARDRWIVGVCAVAATAISAQDRLYVCKVGGIGRNLSGTARRDYQKCEQALHR